MESLLDKIRKRRDVSKVAIHDDADGITCGVLLNLVYTIHDVFCPQEFGDAEDSEVVADMIPKEKNKPYLVFDHHPNHPPKGERKYTLVWDVVPASLIIYNIFKDQIPKDERWKVAVGVVGDGQAELIPTEIWRDFPELMDGYSTVYEKYGLKFSMYPIYARISSGINATCKLAEDKWYTGYQVLKNASSPIDLIEDPSLVAAKALLREEYRNVLKETHPIDLPYIRFWKIKSHMKMERHLAPIAMKNSIKSTMIVNDLTKKISLRGALTVLICEQLNKMGYNINGHPGFAGGQLRPDQEPEDLLKDLKKIRL